MKHKKNQFLEFFRKIFGGTEISWKFLVIFAVSIGVFVGILVRIPFLENTSFTDIAVVLDMWIVLAIFIITNAKTRKEAILKTFVFFLISQPLIYLTEASINSLFFGVDFFAQISLYFNNYYFHGGNWFLWTLLTIPGAAIAFEIKKENFFAPFILSVATGFLAAIGGFGMFNSIFRTFPNHLLNNILCLFFAFSLGFIILKNKRQKIINLVISIVLFLAGVIGFFVTNFGNFEKTYSIDYAEGTTFSEITSPNESAVKVEVSEGGKKLNFTSSEVYGTFEIELEDSAGETHNYIVESSRDSFFVTEL